MVASRSYMAHERAHPDYRELLRNSAFVRYWLGTSLSQLGDLFATVALTWLVLQLTGSAAAIGTVLASYTLPMLATSAFAGALLDRLPRKLLLIVDNGLRGVLLATVSLLAWADAFSLPVVVSLMLVSGSLSAITKVGTLAVLPNLVGRKLLATANSFTQISWQVSYLVGPAVGGVSTAVLGAPATLLLNAATFWIFAFLLATVPRASFQAAAEEGGSTENSVENEEKLWTSLKSGASFLVHHKGLLTLAFATLFFNFVYGPLEPALAVLVERKFNQGPDVLGYLWTALAAGMILGTAIWSKVQLQRPPWMLCGTIIGAWGLINMVLAVSHEVPLALAAMFLAGTVFGPYNVIFATYEQEVIPDALRGRVLGAIVSMTAAGLPLGQLVGGLSVAWLGATITIICAGIASLLVAVALLLSSLRLAERENSNFGDI
jgi:MFS family permease